MPSCHTVSLHITREAMEDGCVLVRVGERLFRLYERQASCWNIKMDANTNGLRRKTPPASSG
ncbi:hypothetical protein [uncultured Desulfovibrio sp.]|uniref:hypothetical protein n=1 Tax=uncultured Desulfovibrio sp. TaxID=167968 RepID=UPI0026255ECC|nr:hypothetical protein [uncultured Desulfovibrio sp.]